MSWTKKGETLQYFAGQFEYLIWDSLDACNSHFYVFEVSAPKWCATVVSPESDPIINDQHKRVYLEVTLKEPILKLVKCHAFKVKYLLAGDAVFHLDYLKRFMSYSMLRWMYNVGNLNFPLPLSSIFDPPHLLI